MNRLRSLRSFPMSCVYGSWRAPFRFFECIGTMNGLWQGAVSSRGTGRNRSGGWVCDPQHVRLRAGYWSSRGQLCPRCRRGSKSRAPKNSRTICDSRTSNIQHPRPNTEEGAKQFPSGVGRWSDRRHEVIPTSRRFRRYSPVGLSGTHQSRPGLLNFCSRWNCS